MVLLLARCWEYKLKTEDVLELTQVRGAFKFLVYLSETLSTLRQDSAGGICIFLFLCIPRRQLLLSDFHSHVAPLCLVI